MPSSLTPLLRYAVNLGDPLNLLEVEAPGPFIAILGAANVTGSLDVWKDGVYHLEVYESPKWSGQGRGALIEWDQELVIQVELTHDAQGRAVLTRLSSGTSPAPSPPSEGSDTKRRGSAP